MRSTTQWTLGNAQELSLKAGRTTSSGRSFLYKATLNYALMMLPLSPPLGLLRLAPPEGTSATDDAAQTAPRRLGKASKSVSIFARAPVCRDTCRYCRVRPCDVAVDHDDHTCYDCEQRLLNPDGEPGAPWRPPLLPGCDFWCHRCSNQRCCVRDPHDLHVCMRC